MMRIENHCVGCEKPCIHDACPYYSVECHYCDKCGEPAEICTDDGDFCRECARRIDYDT